MLGAYVLLLQINLSFGAQHIDKVNAFRSQIDSLPPCSFINSGKPRLDEELELIQNVVNSTVRDLFTREELRKHAVMQVLVENGRNDDAIVKTPRLLGEYLELLESDDVHFDVDFQSQFSVTMWTKILPHLPLYLDCILNSIERSYQLALHLLARLHLGILRGLYFGVVVVSRYLVDFKRHITSLGVAASGQGMHKHSETWFLLLQGRKVWWLSDSPSESENPCGLLGEPLEKGVEFFVTSADFNTTSAKLCGL